MDFSLQKEVEIYRMNNCSFWKMESEMQKTEIQKNEVQSSSKDEMARQILSVTEILIAEIGIPFYAKNCNQSEPSLRNALFVF